MTGFSQVPVTYIGPFFCRVPAFVIPYHADILRQGKNKNKTKSILGRKRREVHKYEIIVAG